MEAGQCYTCTMVGRGVCSCEDAGGWQGICPYSEYVQQGRTARKSPWDTLAPAVISGKTSLSGRLSVIRLLLPAGLVQQYRRPGAYLMAETMGWRTPLSVMRTGWEEGGAAGWVEVLLKVCGPKSQALLQQKEIWNIAGPYFNGLPGADALEAVPEFITARGTAVAPLIHMLECLGDETLNRTLYIDDEELPQAFLEEYLQGRVLERIRLSSRQTLEWMKGQVRKTVQEEKKRAVLLVSPYYIKKLTEGLDEEERFRVIIPNPSNLCCGMGICGACSFADSDGVTVRLCKCSQTVIE